MCVCLGGEGAWQELHKFFTFNQFPDGDVAEDEPCEHTSGVAMLLFTATVMCPLLWMSKLKCLEPLDLETWCRVPTEKV